VTRRADRRRRHHPGTDGIRQARKEARVGASGLGLFPASTTSPIAECGTATCPVTVSSGHREIRPGRPARGRRLPSGAEEQAERREQDEGGNQPASDLETHRATSLFGLTVSCSLLGSWRQRSRRWTTRSSTRLTWWALPSSQSWTNPGTPPRRRHA